MPRTALRQPDSGQPTPPHQPVLRQRVHGVLTTGRGKPARRQSQRRHHVPVQLDDENQPAHDRRSRRHAATARTVTSCHSPFGSRRLDAPQAGPEFVRPTGPRRRRGCSAAPGSRRAPTGPVHPRRRAPHGATAGPTGAVARPIRPIERRSVRPSAHQPLVIAAPHIDDEVWLHGSSPVLDRGIEIGRPRHAVPRGKHRCDTGIEIKQSASDGPCDADSTRLPGRPWCASAAGSRARGLGAGYSAGRSACPLPRLSPCCIWHRAPARYPVPVGHACPHEASVGFVSRW